MGVHSRSTFFSAPVRQNDMPDLNLFSGRLFIRQESVCQELREANRTDASFNQIMYTNRDMNAAKSNGWVFEDLGGGNWVFFHKCAPVSTKASFQAKDATEAFSIFQTAMTDMAKSDPSKPLISFDPDRTKVDDPQGYREMGAKSGGGVGFGRGMLSESNTGQAYHETPSYSQQFSPHTPIPDNFEPNTDKPRGITGYFNEGSSLLEGDANGPKGRARLGVDHKAPNYQVKEAIQKHLDSGKTREQVAKESGVPLNAINTWMDKKWSGEKQENEPGTTEAETAASVSMKNGVPVQEGKTGASKEELSKARELGKAAFSKKKPAAPISDPDLKTLIGNFGPVGDKRPGQMMSAWSDGWNSANMAAPVHFKEATVEFIKVEGDKTAEQMAMAISAHRRDHMMTTPELSQATGISQPDLIAMERQQKMPSAEEIKKLSSALKFNFQTIIDKNTKPGKVQGPWVAKGYKSESEVTEEMAEASAEPGFHGKTGKYEWHNRGGNVFLTFNGKDSYNGRDLGTVNTDYPVTAEYDDKKEEFKTSKAAFAKVENYWKKIIPAGLKESETFDMTESSTNPADYLIKSTQIGQDNKWRVDVTEKASGKKIASREFKQAGAGWDTKDLIDPLSTLAMTEVFSKAQDEIKRKWKAFRSGQETNRVTESTTPDQAKKLQSLYVKMDKAVENVRNARKTKFGKGDMSEDSRLKIEELQKKAKLATIEYYDLKKSLNESEAIMSESILGIFAESAGMSHLIQESKEAKPNPFADKTEADKPKFDFSKLSKTEAASRLAEIHSEAAGLVARISSLENADDDMGSGKEITGKEKAKENNAKTASDNSALNEGKMPAFIQKAIDKKAAKDDGDGEDEEDAADEEEESKKKAEAKSKSAPAKTESPNSTGDDLPVKDTLDGKFDDVDNTAEEKDLLTSPSSEKNLLKESRVPINHPRQPDKAKYIPWAAS